MNNTKANRRSKIRKRVRGSIRGTADKPRLSVFKSNKHVYLQLIDDAGGTTVMAASTMSTDLQKDLKGKSPVEAAKIIGKSLAEHARDKGVVKVVFDRSGYIYHGIVKAAAEGAREGGFDF